MNCKTPHWHQIRELVSVGEELHTFGVRSVGENRGKKIVFISRKQHLKESFQRLLRIQHPKTTSWVCFAPQFFLAWRSGCKATGRHQGGQILHTQESDHQTWGSRYDSPGCAIHNDTPTQNEQSHMKASLGIPSLDTRTSKCSVYSPRPPHPPPHTHSL